MGVYVNPGSDAFQEDVADQMYVDKTGLVSFTNGKLGTRNNKICVSRPRRFGKSMAISMLEAYYSRGANSRDLFSGLEAETCPTFLRHLNQHYVISFDVQEFRTEALNNGNPERFLAQLQMALISELAVVFPDEAADSNQTLANVIQEIHKRSGVRFVLLIDEWDVVYRDDRNNSKLKEEYTSFLSGLFKGKVAERSIALAYMTGILPIPPQETESALNNFQEFTMLFPGPLACYVGFTEPEVKTLCSRSSLTFEEVKRWYDGYSFPEAESIYCPASVINALSIGAIQNYWSETSSNYFLKDSLFSGHPKLNEMIGILLSGQSIPLSPGSRKIVFGHPADADDILISLIHLGYLSYDDATKSVRVPNEEITTELYSILKRIPDHPAGSIISKSFQLLQDTLSQDEDAVASAIQYAHDYYTSALKYNDENSLASVVVLAYHAAVSAQYELIREFPSGKGYADILFYPRTIDRLPILIELKWKQDAETALSQIHERQYWARLKNFRQILLVGINYNKNPTSADYKNHTCKIELLDLRKK